MSLTESEVKFVWFVSVWTDIIHKVVEISFKDFESFRQFCWNDMGSAISKCKKLKRNNSWNVWWFDWRELKFPAEGPYSFLINVLTFDERSIGLGGMSVLLPFLKSFLELHVFCCHKCELGNEELLLVAEAIDMVWIRYLGITLNDIKIEGLFWILSANNAKSLKHLVLHDDSIWRVKIDTIAQFIQRDDTSLSSINMSGASVNAKPIGKLVESLHNNKKMKGFICLSFSHQCYEGSTYDHVAGLWCIQCGGIVPFKPHYPVFGLWFFVDFFVDHFPIVKHEIETIGRQNWTFNRKIFCKMALVYFHNKINLQQFFVSNQLGCLMFWNILPHPRYTNFQKKVEL